jgi:antitoxin HigA-1
MAEMTEPAFRPMFDPPHPGLSIKIDCLEPAGLTVTDGAKALGVSRQALSKLINGAAGVSPEMALRLAKAFGGTPDMWLRLQMAYDLAQALKRESEITKDVHPVTMAA